MSQKTNLTQTKLCPICGTKLSDSATRCLVCGSAIEDSNTGKTNQMVKANRLPEIKISLPMGLGLLAVLITLLTLVIVLAIQTTKPLSEVTEPQSTSTSTPTETATPTITFTPTLVPTSTPLPPIEYTVVEGDVCSGIAAVFGVSIQSIIRENNLNASCSISPGMVLKVPQPTPTASPQPTGTLNPEQSADTACQTLSYEVQPFDTLSSIANNYNVPMSAIREYSGMINDVVYEGLYLTIPLCERKPTAGPSPTPTPPPPYPAPNLLLPIDGSPFSLSSEAITLQWASVAELRPNEYYVVTVQDLTSPEKRILTEYVSDTKYIIPLSFRPTDSVPHIMRWWVSVARRIDTNSNNPIYEIAGMTSDTRVFSWTAISFQTTTSP